MLTAAGHKDEPQDRRTMHSDWPEVLCSRQPLVCVQCMMMDKQIFFKLEGDLSDPMVAATMMLCGGVTEDTEGWNSFVMCEGS